jgi:hypothetical protein
MNTNCIRSLRILMLMAVLAGHSYAQTTTKSAPASQPVSEPANGSGFHISAKGPRPLERAIDALRLKYGWAVSYEDPQYLSPKDMTESTGAKGIEIPGKKETMVPAGDAFSVDLTVPKSAADAPPEDESLKLVVEAYNRSGNPGQFELRKIADGVFSVVGVAARDEKGTISAQKPLFDAIITVPGEKRTIDKTLNIICQKLTKATHTPVSIGITPRNLLERVSVSAGGTNLPARTLLSQALSASGHPLYWRLLFDPNSKEFLLNVHTLRPPKPPVPETPGKPPQPDAHPSMPKP